MTPPAPDEETRDLADDAQRLLQQLDRELAGAPGTSGDCRPPIDVVELPSAVEVVVDVPGVPAQALRVAVRRNRVLVVGAKRGAAPTPDARFHVAERSYGQFARAVRVEGAFDIAGARAVVASGQLRVILPRREDRRGQLFDVPVERG